MKKTITKITMGYWSCIMGALFVQYLFMHEIKDFGMKLLWIIGGYVIVLFAGIIIKGTKKSK